jgi:hypothetical protein
VWSPFIKLPKLVSLSVLLSIVLVCFVSSKFYPWYQGMLIPLALCLQPGHWLRVLVISLSWFQMLSFTFIEQAHILNYVIMTVVPAWWVIRRYGLFAGSWADFNIPGFCEDGRQEKAAPDLLF